VLVLLLFLQESESKLEIAKAEIERIYEDKERALADVEQLQVNVRSF
jgi:hypothetical protein